MDLLFSRYASPFALLDPIVASGDLSQFVSEIWDIVEEEKEWQYFLHKIFDKSFSEFRESIKPQTRESRKEFAKDLGETLDFLNDFDPTSAEVKDLNGII